MPPLLDSDTAEFALYQPTAPAGNLFVQRSSTASPLNLTKIANCFLPGSYRSSTSLRRHRPCRRTTSIAEYLKVGPVIVAGKP